MSENLLNILFKAFSKSMQQLIVQFIGNRKITTRWNATKVSRKCITGTAQVVGHFFGWFNFFFFFFSLVTQIWHLTHKQGLVIWKDLFQVLLPFIAQWVDSATRQGICLIIVLSQQLIIRIKLLLLQFWSRSRNRKGSKQYPIHPNAFNLT